MRTQLDTITIAGSDRVIVTRRPTDDEIMQWLTALHVPLGESVTIDYDESGPRRIVTRTRGTWVINGTLPAVKCEPEIVCVAGIEFVKAALP